MVVGPFVFRYVFVPPSVFILNEDCRIRQTSLLNYTNCWVLLCHLYIWWDYYIWDLDEYLWLCCDFKYKIFINFIFIGRVKLFLNIEKFCFYSYLRKSIRFEFLFRKKNTSILFKTRIINLIIWQRFVKQNRFNCKIIVLKTRFNFKEEINNESLKITDATFCLFCRWTVMEKSVRRLVSFYLFYGLY